MSKRVYKKAKADGLTDTLSLSMPILYDRYMNYVEFNEHITNIRYSFEKEGTVSAYVYLTKFFGSTKKANKIADLLTKIKDLNMYFEREATLGFPKIGDLHSRDSYTRTVETIFGYNGRSISDNISNSTPPIKSDFFNTVYNNKDMISAKNWTRHVLVWNENDIEHYRMYVDLGSILENKMFRYIHAFTYEQMVNILQLFIRKNVDIHDYLENTPVSMFKKIADNGMQYRDECYNYIVKTLNTNSPIQLIKYVNYAKARLARNKLFRDEHILLVGRAIDARLERERLAREAAAQAYASRYPYMDKPSRKEIKVSKPFVRMDMDDKQVFIKFSKDPADINNIGSRTDCCFRPTGLAASLVEASLESPIAGILEGLTTKGRTWFAFVWEIVEYNEDLGVFETNLILDNVESNGKVYKEDWTNIVDWLIEHTRYSRIYLGALRNDIESTDIFVEEQSMVDDYHILNIAKVRPRTLINFESNFRRYSYDDSKNVYTVTSRKVPTMGMNSVKLALVDAGWKSRIDYLEKIVWKDGHDNDFGKIDITKTPSFVIYDDVTSSVLGYVVTAMYKYDEENSKLMVSGKEEYANVLYIEDIVLPHNLQVTKSLIRIIELLNVFVKENDIKYISAALNDNSKPFKKRMEKYAEFIEDNRLTSVQPNSDTFRNGYTVLVPVGEVKDIIDIEDVISYGKSATKDLAGQS